VSLADYRNDFDRYARELLYITDAQRNLRMFNMNVVQRKIHEQFQPRLERGRVFLYVLKARQEGVSTYAEARVFHSAHLWPNTRAGIAADEIERSEQIFKMTRQMYERLPKEYRPMTRYSTKRELLFENPSKHGRYDEPGLGSSIEVFTAGNANIGRGFTFNICHLSEFAFYPNGPEMMDALTPTIHQSPGHFVIMETTADRAGSFAHDEWIRYKLEFEKNMDGELLPIFLAWWELPAYQRAFTDEAHRKALRQGLDEEEKSLIKRFNLTLEQLYWRRDQIRVMKGDLNAFRHEYPCDDEECWIFAGVPVFDRDALSKSWQSLPDNPWRGDISANGNLVASEGGRFTIYKKPERDRRYVVGVDPSGGSVDEAVIEVLDADTLEQCAEWAGVVGGVELAQYIWPIGLAYGGIDGQALLAIEITGGYGITPQNELMSKYWNMYRWPRFDTIAQPESNKLGWETNMRTKPLLVDFGQFCFNNGYTKVNSDKLLKEMSKFIRDDSTSGRGQASPDNRVMAWLIAAFVAGSGRTDLISAGTFAQERPLIKDPALDVEAEKHRLFFGRTLDTQCDLDYMYGKDSDDYDPATNWQSY